tara:strand:+ start:50 stop:454 length:405 start_codon:yes stop_codon:yes gene_type:complete
MTKVFFVSEFEYGRSSVENNTKHYIRDAGHNIVDELGIDDYNRADPDLRERISTARPDVIFLYTRWVRGQDPSYLYKNLGSHGTPIVVLDMRIDNPKRFPPPQIEEGDAYINIDGSLETLITDIPAAIDRVLRS